MPYKRSRSHVLTRAAAAVLVATALLCTGLTAASTADLQSQIAAGQGAAASLRSAVAADAARIQGTASGLQSAQGRLGALQSDLDAREAHLRAVQLRLLSARNRLVDLENELHRASVALASNLVARYEHGQPDLMTVVLEARGFRDLLEQFGFMRRIGDQDTQVIAATRAARAEVSREAVLLGSLERRDRRLTVQVLAERNQVAALQAALLGKYIAQTHARTPPTRRSSSR
jgi:septal ring factor EnvC (AmiA/AmiB activator)